MVLFVYVCHVCAHANPSVYVKGRGPLGGAKTSTRFPGIKLRVLGTLASIYSLNHLTDLQIKFTLKIKKKNTGKRTYIKGCPLRHYLQARMNTSETT